MSSPKSLPLAWRMYHPGVIHPYCTLASAWPVWFYLRNRRSRNRFHRDRVVLNDLQANIVSDLKQNGIAITHLDELFPGSPVSAELTAQANALFDTVDIRSRKMFLRQLFELTPTLDLKNPFVKWSLDPKILDVVNSYMGIYAKFYYYALNVAEPVPPGAKPVQSQRWHRDSDDKKLCKAFIYLNDVSGDEGPFTYVLGSQYGGPRRKFFPQRPRTDPLPPLRKCVRGLRSGP